MDRLPIRPAIFMAVYWGIMLAAFAVMVLMTPGSSDAGSLLTLVGLVIIGLAAGLWQVIWLWQVVRYAAARRPAATTGPDRMRTMRRLGWVLWPAYLAYAAASPFVLGMSGAPARDRLVGGFLDILPIVVMATFIMTFWNAARAVCEAEAPWRTRRSPGVFWTFVGLMYAPFFAAIPIQNRLKDLEPPPGGARVA